MQISGPHAFVMGRGMMLREVVGKVELAWRPEDGVLILINAILKPIETHVNGLGTSLLDSVTEDALGTCIVCLNGGGWLWVAKVNESLADWAAVLSAHEGSSHFSFSSRGHHWANETA